MDIVYREDQPRREKLLRSVDRPGDFYAHGRSFDLMPRIAVDGVGVLSFPVPDTQVRALMAEAERAPYGRGPDTVVDTAVRDCWQIDAARVQVAGGTWPATFEQILAAAGVGLGCPADRLDARLYKLLIYEPGGFFAPHRDTEKADGMVATLSIALPVAGAGGDAGLLEGRYAECEKVTLVCDNLNPHTKGAFCEVFEPVRARELVRRLEFCYTPKHGSWLNIAENELSAMTRQCLRGRRIVDLETLHGEVSAWSADVTGRQRGVDWQMKVDDARCKLKSVYPKIVM